MSKVIGVVGSRSRNTKEDYEAVREAFFKEYEPGDSIVSGGCRRGADRFAFLLALEVADKERFKLLFPSIWTASSQALATLCKEWKAPITVHWALWGIYCNAAGSIRNTPIARDAQVLIACCAEGGSPGTSYTIAKFRHFHPEGKLILV